MSSVQHRSDSEIVAKVHNTSRFCVENRQIAWVLLAGTVLWGIFGYLKMPQRKDPDVPPKVAKVITPWPGASAEKVEQLVTRNLERVIATNSTVSRIESVSRTNVSEITITLANNLKSTGQTLDDIGERLAGIKDLPQGAGPINFQRDFGDTATLLMTVASPKTGAADLAVRADAIRSAINAVRSNGGPDRATLILCFPPKGDKRLIVMGAAQFAQYLAQDGIAQDAQVIQGSGFVGIDASSTAADQQILDALQRFLAERYRASEIHPDAWRPFVVRNAEEIAAKLKDVAGEKYSYREMDDLTDLMEKELLGTKRTSDGPPLVAKVIRSGILNEKIYLLYSQKRLAAYGIKPENLQNILSARNITISGGQIDLAGKSVAIAPTGEFHSEQEIGGVSIGVTPYGTPLYLRDVVDVARAYDNPPSYLEFTRFKDANGQWQRTRSISLSVQMGAGQQIDRFAKAVDKTLEDLKARLPKDLIIARTSDQPEQVAENVDLFMDALYEAIALVVLVSLIGFWEWRSALLMALSIPITLLMTFGMMYTCGIDIQQVSIATLIIALGLLVDDPVVAGDAIKRSLADGNSSVVAAWLGPTKLAKAIMYATVTNIVAYLPFLLLSGGTGQFLYSLPITIACSLIASRVASMTFIPLLGYYLLRPKSEEPVEERRKHGFAAAYYRVGQFAIAHRWPVLIASFGVLALGGFFGKSLKQQFFPKDLSHLAYIAVTLPDDAPFDLTNDTAKHVEQIVEQLNSEQHRSLESITTSVGGGGARFWYSLSPESRHANYAQIVMLFKDKHDTTEFLAPLQRRLSHEVAGARIDVRQLETGDAVGLPVQIRVSGEDIATIRDAAARVQNVLRDIPIAARVRDDWGEDRFNVDLAIDADRANLAGITNLDAAKASATAVSGYQVAILRDSNKQIPVVARLRPDERVKLEDLNNLYVYSGSGSQKVPLSQIAKVEYRLRNDVIARRNQVRTITVSAAPQENVLASEIIQAAKPQLDAISRSLPPGYRLEIGGEQEKQKDGFGELAMVLLISVLMIFLALAFQFNSAVKPLIVFAAVPYGAVGALAALWIMGSPFGFMGFLGVVSLVGVIVSHIIVLFDFIEEKHAEGEPFQMAVLDAGIMRLRPVMITVGATVIALFPLAMHGGPLWEPMCYAQIGGLIAATFITLLLVPVIYSICVLDLKIIRWENTQQLDIEGHPANTAVQTAA